MSPECRVKRLSQRLGPDLQSCICLTRHVPFSFWHEFQAPRRTSYMLECTRCTPESTSIASMSMYRPSIRLNGCSACIYDHPHTESYQLGWLAERDSCILGVLKRFRLLDNALGRGQRPLSLYGSLAISDIVDRILAAEWLRQRQGGSWEYIRSLWPRKVPPNRASWWAFLMSVRSSKGPRRPRVGS